MTRVSLDRLAQALGVNDERERDSHSFATVTAVNADGSYQVAFNGSLTSTRAAKCCNAETGDRVLCVLSNGQVSAIGRVGGEKRTGLELLWENDNVSAVVGSLTLAVDWTPYQFLFVECYTQAGAGLDPHTEVSVISTNDISTPKFVTIVREATIFRRVQLQSGSIYFSQGYWYRDWNGAAPEVGNAYITPYRVYGVTELVAAGGGGGGTGEDASYVHVQSTPAALWSISHGLGKYPSVTVVDSGGSVVEGDVNYISTNNVQLTFSAAFSGSAYLN